MSDPWPYLISLLELGPRPIGSPANQAAAEYLLDAFTRFGYEVEAQPYPCTAWEATSVALERSGAQLEVCANAFSLPCDVRAGVLPIGTLAELQSLPAGAARDRVLLLFGELTGNPLAPKSWFLKSERDDLVIRLLEGLRPSAVLSPPTDTDYAGQLTEDWELDLAAATIPAPVALEILKDPGEPVHLDIAAQRRAATASNVVARKARRDQARLVVCAHFDTKFGTPGASDNAGGAAVLLALAEAFKDRDLPVGLEFVAFNGEEYLPVGDEEYLRRSHAYFSHIAACMNFDGAGTALGATSVTSMEFGENTRVALEALVAAYPSVAWVEPWPESNHSTFTMRGVPAIAFGAVGTRCLAHTPEDDLQVMHPGRLREVLDLSAETLTLLSGRAAELKS